MKSVSGDENADNLFFLLFLTDDYTIEERIV